MNGEPGPGAGHEQDFTLIRLLRRFNVASDQFVQLFGEAHGLHRTDLNALVVIMDTVRRGESISAGQLARALHLSASATTALLDRLEAAGHVRRDRHPADRRRIHLVMPERTAVLAERFFGPLRTEFARAWAGLGPGERETVARFLTVTIEAADRARAGLADPTPDHEPS